MYPTRPYTGQAVSGVGAIPACKLVVVHGISGPGAIIARLLGNAGAATILIVLIPAQAHLVCSRAYTKYRELPLALEGIDHSLILEVAIGTASGIELAEEALFHVLLQLQIDGACLFAIVDACKLGLVAFLVEHLYLVDNGGLQALCYHLGVVGEELFAVYQYLLHFYALCGDLAVLIDLYARQLLQQLLYGGTSLYTEAIGHIFCGVALDLDSGHLLGEDVFLEQVLFGQHDQLTEIGKGVFEVDHIGIVGIAGSGNL